MSGISWEEFLRCALNLIEISDRTGDEWSFEGDRSTPGAAYLKKTRLSLDSNGSVLKWEYHVCYSVSYAGPMVYFNVWNRSGVLLSSEEIWESRNPIYKSNEPEEMFSALTQTEHPVLLRPFFAVHPCRTHEFLSENGSNALIKFISTVGPLIDLKLKNEYGIKL